MLHFSSTLSRLACLVASACLCLPAQAAIDLADYPLFSTVKVPGNLALALSVEWPTATTSAYGTSTAYASTSTFIGYFNPEMCYQYVVNTSTVANSYFLPVSAASSHVCSGLWSGNYMNWAAMQTLDEFRWIMTGGGRSTDTNTATSTSSTHLGTVLTKTYAATDSTSSAPDKTTPSSSSTAAGATPLTWTSVSSRIRNLGNRMWFTSGGDLSNASSSGTTTKKLVAYTSQGSAASTVNVYEVYVNVAVCVSKALKEDNCVLYGSAYKPEGLMQTYAMQLRYAAFGYLNHNGDSSSTGQQRDGGVLRARMNYIGPTKPVPGSADVTNDGFPEWSASTGIMASNPAATDAADTVSTFGLASTAVVQSGAMNYLNKFGNYAHAYKSKDPVSELYNTVLRYYKGLSNWNPYTSATSQASTTTTTTASATTYATYADGFPVITKWRKTDSSTMGADPILYACQKNFILGIGDVNTHRDANLYGSSLRLGSTLDNVLSYPTDDSSVNAATATNMVGALEGNTALGNTYQATGTSSCASGSSYAQCNSYYIAGLAYDAHTVDLRADWTGTQTINTYWMDVMESQTYVRKNQYWLAAKYGGFTVPSSFSPYSSSNGTSTLSDSTWYTNSDTNTGLTTSAGLGFSTDTTYDKRPDNYYFGSSPATMKSGLAAAFNKISTELSSANSSTYAMASPNVVSGDASYSASYDPTNWTSSVVGATLSYDTSGNATATAIWNARTKLEALSAPASSRKIITYCDTTLTGIAFSATALTTCGSTGRLYYPAFAAITGTTSVSSTPAADYLAYLRGDRTNELSSTVTATNRIYRKRDYLLGDIVNSKVTAVNAPSMAYYDMYNLGYTAFKNTYASRKTVVYAGGNDGMLHAFDGSMPGTTSSGTTAAPSTCTACGQELFAYVPSFVYGSSSTATTAGLASIGSPTRAHYYQVDATPLSFDVDANKVCAASSSTTAICGKLSSTPDWRTLLVGGLGKGGKGFYALDVTNPGTAETTTAGITTAAGSGDWSSETSLATKVLWEFPRTTDTTTIARMGYSFGAPMAMKTAKYGWVLVFTSGYNNTDGKGYFFIVNPRTGALLETVATPNGSTTAPINLAQAESYSPNQTDFTADAIYAGDLQGNLWRLDLTPTTSTYAAPTLMATLYKTSGTPQPVTTRPLIEVDPTTSKRYVILGTGRLLADSDISSTAVQSIYAVYDGTMGAGAFQAASVYATPLTRSALEANTSMLTGIGSAPTSSLGWYYDLSTDASTGIAERVNVNPTAYSGSAIFGVNLPNGAVCSPSGTGYLLGFNIATGASILQNSAGTTIAQSATLSGVIVDLAIQNINGKLRVLAGDSTGTTITSPAALSTSSGIKRLNWREVSAQ